MSEPIISSNPAPKKIEIFSSSEYTKGETNIRNDISEIVGGAISTHLNKFLIYFITVLLVGMGVVLWGMNAQINQLSGKYSSPDKVIETIGIRLENLEKSNQALLEKNYQLSIEKFKLESKLKEKK